MPLALDLTSTLVTGWILPVATTLLARSPLSTLPRREGSILVPPRVAATNPTTIRATTRTEPMMYMKRRFFLLLPLPLATNCSLLALPVISTPGKGNKFLKKMIIEQDCLSGTTLELDTRIAQKIAKLSPDWGELAGRPQGGRPAGLELFEPVNVEFALRAGDAERIMRGADENLPVGHDRGSELDAEAGDVGGVLRAVVELPADIGGVKGAQDCGRGRRH